MKKRAVKRRCYYYLASYTYKGGDGSTTFSTKKKISVGDIRDLTNDIALDIKEKDVVISSIHQL